MNKEFEKWREKYVCSYCERAKEACQFCNKKNLISPTVCFEAGQQSERDKHRWIPVTERLPTEKDGIFIDEENSAIDILCKTDRGTKIVAVYRFSDEQFFYDTKITNDMLNITNNIAAWQPLPEE